MEKVVQKHRDWNKIRVAVFDFDGTISTLRSGWESVMEETCLFYLADSGCDPSELSMMIRKYIDASAGIQTIFQMEWLAQKIQEMCGRSIDPWECKDEYNSRLLAMIARRTDALALGEKQPENFLVPGSLRFLKKLNSMSIPVFVASGTDDPDVKREADLLGVSPWVKEIRGAPLRQKGCSKEAVLRMILEEQGVNGEQLLVAGDGKVEIELGASVGAVTLGIASEEKAFLGKCNANKKQKLFQAGADYILPDFRMAAELFDTETAGGEKAL